MKILLFTLLALHLTCSANAEETAYRTFIASPNEIRIFWLDSTGKRFGQIKQLAEELLSKDQAPSMLMNGGIFEPEGIPSGLLISDGELQHPVNQSNGKGNFYLMPNGIFYIDSLGAHVATTKAYTELNPSPRCAVQSGPILLSDGQIHPAFRPNSESRLHRNGVGILENGKVLFVITEFGQDHYPNLYEFAEYFREHGCKNALFLDGDISQMEIDSFDKLIPGNYFGSIIAVVPIRVQQGAAANP